MFLKNSQTTNNTNNDWKDIDKKGQFTISYIQKIANKYNNITNDLDASLSFFSLNKLGIIIKTQKNCLFNLSQKMWFIKLYARIVMLYM